jgi:hypothetical protein
MSTAEIRQKLHSYIDHAEDKKVKAFYTILQEEIKPNDIWSDESFVKDLENRVAEIESGRVKGYTWEEVQANAVKSLKASKQG